jgi:GntR family transcriptional regulator, transcriptional repressor for pyruvate dehydrogenase complex
MLDGAGRMCDKTRMAEWFAHSSDTHGFKNVRHSNVYENVVAQVEEGILSDRLKPGDRLPSERKLTEVFQTSRRTLREAMRVLEQKGLIEIRIGSKGGAFVTDRSSDRMKESLSLLIRQKKIRYESLVEFRYELEGNVAVLAAERALPAEVEALKNLLEETKRLAEAGLESSNEFNDQETRLHLYLSHIGKNPLYEVILETIHEVLVFPSFKVVRVDQEYLRTAYQDWVAIVRAIEKRQAARAGNLMRQHLEWFSRYHRAKGELFDGKSWRIVRKKTGH